jgi:Tfp pilus assembly protein PilF
MSLIADALKTAQREKQRHTAGDRALSVPVLVPLRARQAPGFNWRRAVGLGVAGTVMLGASLVALQRARTAGTQSPRTTSAPAASIPVATPPSFAPATSTTASRHARATASTAHRDTIRAAAAAPTPLNVVPPTQIATQHAPQSNTTQATGVRPADTPAVQQAATLPRESAPAPAPGGRLRIAVDQPRDAEVARLFAIGVAAHRNGDLSGAHSAYESVLTLAPNDVDALNNLALVMLAEGDASRAEVLLRRALSLAPRNAGAWNNLGAVLRVRGGSRANEAVAAFQHALNIDPQNQAARVSLAQQFLAIGSLDQARALLVESVAADPNAADAQYTLGQVLELQGDSAGAVRAYREFIRVAPPRLAASVDRVKLHLDTLEAHP